MYLGLKSLWVVKKADNTEWKNQVSPLQESTNATPAFGMPNENNRYRLIPIELTSESAIQHSYQSLKKVSLIWTAKTRDLGLSRAKQGSTFLPDLLVFLMPITFDNPKVLLRESSTSSFAHIHKRSATFEPLSASATCRSIRSSFTSTVALLLARPLFETTRIRPAKTVSGRLLRT